MQRNAIKSWIRLGPDCEIILLGKEEGTRETAEEFGIKHIPGIKKNRFGTPLLSSAFSIAQKEAENSVMVYSNSDIIFFSEMASAVKIVKKEKFLISGRRTDLDVNNEIDFKKDWQKKLKKEIEKKGVLHRYSGIDYFIFPRGLFLEIPPFAVGRPAWDNWFIYNARSFGIPFIDATGAVTVVHQNHKSSHAQIEEDKDKKEEADFNIGLTGKFLHIMTLREADFILSSQGELKKPAIFRRILAALAFFYPWRLLLSAARKIKKLFR